MHNTSHLLRPSTDNDSLKSSRAICVNFRLKSKIWLHAVGKSKQMFVLVIVHNNQFEGRCHEDIYTRHVRIMIRTLPSLSFVAVSQLLIENQFYTCKSKAIVDTSCTFSFLWSSPTTTICVTTVNAWGHAV